LSIIRLIGWPRIPIRSACILWVCNLGILAAEAAPNQPPGPPGGEAGLSVQPPSRFKNAPAAASRPATPASTRVITSPEWWRIFREPALDTLEDQALRANQDLAQSVSRIEEARQQEHDAAADFFPHVDANPSAQRLRTTNTGPILKAQLVGNASAFASLVGGGTTGTTTTTTTTKGSGTVPAFSSRELSATYDDFRAPLSLSYELDVFGRIRHQYAGARANFQAAEADQRAVRLSLAGEVATDYFMLRALDSQVAVLRRTLSLRQASVHLNQERLNAGVAGPLDVARAREVLDETQADLDEAIRERAEAENVLAVLCGRVASDFHLAPDPLEDVAPPAVPPGIPADLLVHRPDLAEAERRVDAANEEIGVARARLLPTFSIQANAGFETADQEHLFDAQSRAMSVLGAIDIPIFEGGRNIAGLRAARARRDEAVAQYRGTALTAFREVETALSDVQQRIAQADARRRAIADSNEVLELSQRRYLEGAVNYFDVVDAQRSLLGSELSNVQTLDGRFTATIALIRAIGGGWSQAGPVAPVK
jgi:multidrug efflux system outer membrane protein